MAYVAVLIQTTYVQDFLGIRSLSRHIDIPQIIELKILSNLHMASYIVYKLSVLFKPAQLFFFFFPLPVSSLTLQKAMGFLFVSFKTKSLVMLLLLI